MIAADLAQAEQGGEQVEALLVELLRRFHPQQHLLRALELRPVQRQLLALELAVQVFLDPVRLDRALAQGCGEAPTVVVLSGCYSGIFARPPMTRPNRVILTAARIDRPSFGCSIEDQFTEFDAHYFPETPVRISRLSEPKNYSLTVAPGRTGLCPQCGYWRSSTDPGGWPRYTATH